MACRDSRSTLCGEFQSSRLPGRAPMARVTVSLGIALFLVAMSAGCGGAPASQLDRHVVSGTVTFDGKPLEAGAIQFFPLESGPKKTVSGGVIQAGSFRLSPEAGLPPGKYRVSITSVASTGPVDSAAAMKPVQDAKPVSDPIPSKYNATSELTCEVKGEGSTELPPFDLKSK